MILAQTESEHINQLQSLEVFCSSNV